MNLLDAGLYYLKRGFSVIPFKHDKSKACVKWEKYQSVHPSVEDVKEWFSKRFSNEFIAIITGKISGIIVVDCDSQEAYEKIQEFLPTNFITPIAKTKRGYHIYFKYRPGLVSRAKYMPDVDVRTDEGCIIAPPSQNGDNVSYKWLPGLSIEKTEIAPLPEELFIILNQFVYSSYNNNIIKDEVERQDATQATNSDKMFEYGRRDDDLFHTANCLVKGCMPTREIHQVLEKIIISWGENPDKNWIDTKIKSAMQRKETRERNLSSEIREWVGATTGDFSATNCDIELQIATKIEKRNRNKILERLCKDEIIERVGSKNGWYRLIDQDCKPMDWINADCNYKELWLPLGLGDICGVQPGNILVFAGAKDSGKTGWLLNIAKENRQRYAIHYFNSEMGASEFKLRASLFDDIQPEQWRNVSVYERTDNFADVIKPGEGNLNIIDFLEVVDEFWKVAATIQKIHKKLDGAMCVIAIQKNPGVDLGRGGAFSLEKARLYVSLDYQLAKIISCKNYKENGLIRGNPRGYTCRYKLINGCKIQRIPPGWTSPIQKEVTNERI